MKFWLVVCVLNLTAFALALITGDVTWLTLANGLFASVSAGIVAHDYCQLQAGKNPPELSKASKPVNVLTIGEHTMIADDAEAWAYSGTFPSDAHRDALAKGRLAYLQADTFEQAWAAETLIGHALGVEADTEHWTDAAELMTRRHQLFDGQPSAKCRGDYERPHGAIVEYVSSSGGQYFLCEACGGRLSEHGYLLPSGYQGPDANPGLDAVVLGR